LWAKRRHPTHSKAELKSDKQKYSSPFGNRNANVEEVMPSRNKGSHLLFIFLRKRNPLLSVLLVSVVLFQLPAVNGGLKLVNGKFHKQTLPKF
jgi:hypothetical protein